MNHKKLVTDLLKLITFSKLSKASSISRASLKYERKDFTTIQKSKLDHARNVLYNELDLVMFDILKHNESQVIATNKLIINCLNSDFVLNELREYKAVYQFVPQIALQVIASSVKINQNQSCNSFTVSVPERKNVLVKSKRTGIIYFNPVVKHDGGYYYTVFEANGEVIIMDYKDNFIIY